MSRTPFLLVRRFRQQSAWVVARQFVHDKARIYRSVHGRFAVSGTHLDVARSLSTTMIGGTSTAFDPLRNNILRDQLIKKTVRRQSLATAAAPKTNATSSSSSSSNTGNVFLDYAGSIFLSAIGVIIVWLVRSYQNTQRRNIFRDAIEDTAHLDPLELDDLRTANTDTVTVEQFTLVLNELVVQPDSIDLTYPQFVQRARSIMMKANDNNAAFTVELGHLVDRVAVAALERHDKTLEDTMPLTFWLTLFSLALSCSATDRIRVLYRMMQAQTKNKQKEEGFQSDSGSINDGDSNHKTNQNDDDTKVAIDQVVELVGYLQDTYQLVPDTQIVATTHKYPLQEYAVGTPEQLVDRHRWVNKEALTHTIDYPAVASILRSKSVCAWGECYHKKKFAT